MRVLLSIKPEFALRIFAGSKRYEYRRVIFKRDNVTRALVYASWPIGKVIGEFEIAGILSDEPKKLWKLTKNYAGISSQRFFEYFSKANRGYAIKVKNYVIYETPIPLKSFMVGSPPQSFLYLD